VEAGLQEWSPTAVRQVASQQTLQDFVILLWLFHSRTSFFPAAVGPVGSVETTPHFGVLSLGRRKGIVCFSFASVARRGWCRTDARHFPRCLAATMDDALPAAHSQTLAAARHVSSSARW
jgi:hypothetical protein